MRKRAKKVRLRQLHFDHKRHCGWREGSGRKAGDRVSHGKRPGIGRGDVGIITIKMADGLPSLRKPEEGQAIFGALTRLRDTCRARGNKFRVLHFSVLSNHLHLIVEADCTADLQTGMRGLMAHLGNALRALWRVNGTVFADRYHLDIINTPTRMRNAFRYVLNNARKHGCWRTNAPDPYSSGRWFKGWTDPIPPEFRPRVPSPVSAPRTWLASVGWRRASPSIAFTNTPPKTRRRKALPPKT